MSKIRAAIIFGGVSNEYETSLKAAAYVINTINSEEYETVCIGITKKGRWLFYPGTAEDIVSDKWSENPDCTPAVISPDPNRKGIIKFENGEAAFYKVDVLFPLLYGKNGEDGTIAGLIRTTGIPFVGSDIMSAAACMDKACTRTILGYNGIRTSNWRMMYRNELGSLDRKCTEYSSEMKFPLIVKPANFGSSEHINKVTDNATLKDAIKLALTQDEKVIVEEFIDGKEIQVAVIGNDTPVVSVPGEVKTETESFDFNSMFARAEHIVPADISKDTSEILKRMALRVFRMMGCSDMARIDFYLTDSEEIIISQINTVPEFSDDSMYVKLMADSGYDGSELISELIAQAIDNYDARSV